MPNATETSPMAGRSFESCKVAWIIVMQFIYGFFFDVCKTTIRYIHRFLSILLPVWLTFWIIWWLLRMSASVSFGTIHSIAAPICDFPTATRILPWCSGQLSFHTTEPSANATLAVDYPSFIDLQASSMSSLLEESMGTASVSWEIKRVEGATRDLATLVRVSNFTERALLADTLQEFVSGARAASVSLWRLSSQVNGAIDSVLAANEYAFRAIGAQDPSSSNNVVLQAFIGATNILTQSATQILVHCEDAILQLDALEQRLDLLLELIEQERLSARCAWADLLAELWTILGGNHRQIKQYNYHLDLLKDISIYRRQALEHIHHVQQVIGQMNEDIMELRERTATPGIVNEPVPLEVQLMSIRVGITRLAEVGMRAQRREKEFAQSAAVIVHGKEIV